MLNLKKVTGSKPVKYEYLRGGTFINVLEKEVEIEDGTQWEYWQTFTTEVDEAKLDVLHDAAIAQINDTTKEEVLGKLTVTTESGKVFYSDSDSRIDLAEAIRVAIDTNQTSTMWKLAEDFEGARIVSVTLEEIKEASTKALVTKGSIVGAV
jgi:hypothetical protein